MLIMATPLPAQRVAIVNLYTALFNRAPDASGLAFWAQAHADGAPLAAITQSFLTTTEGRATYPASQTSGQFVAAFYQTVFGRPADADGLAFWTAALDAAGGAGSDAARAALAGEIIGTVSQPLANKPAGITDAAYAQTVADRALFANKIAVGEYVVSLNINDVELARLVLGWVTPDPASVTSAKNFAANGGVIVLPPDPPMAALAITNADAALDIVSKFAAYAGNIATVNATGMDASKLAAVAGGIAKIAGGGISGTLGLSASDYAGALIDTLAPKLAAGATVTVTTTSGGAPIALKALQRATTINGSSGNEVINAVVDANTPANTTLDARVIIDGGGNISDTLNIVTNGVVGDALNGATVRWVEIVSVYTSAGGSASIVADPAAMLDVVATGLGDLTVTNLTNTSLGLRGTAISGNYHGTYTTTGGSGYLDGASANTLTMDGNLVSPMLTSIGGASHVKSLVLGSSVNALRIQGSGAIAIDGLSGGAAGGLSLTLTGSSGTVTLSGIASAGTNVDGTIAAAPLVLTFNLPAGVVRGGTNSDTLTVHATATLTGNGGADLFAIRAGVGQTGTIDLTSLTAKLVTITDFSAGDRISVETPVAPVTTPAVALQTFVGSGADLHAQTADVAAQMQALTTKVPYGAFAYGGANYLLVDNGLNGLGDGDTLIRLTGTVDLTRVKYTNDVLTMT
jgi:hypothetical protein